MINLRPEFYKVLVFMVGGFWMFSLMVYILCLAWMSLNGIDPSNAAMGKIELLCGTLTGLIGGLIVKQE